MPTKTSTAIVLAPPQKILNGDRCERCGAQAQVRSVFRDTGTAFLLCAHHLKASADTFVRSNVRVTGLDGREFDYRQKLSFAAQVKSLVDKVYDQVEATNYNDGF